MKMQTSPKSRPPSLHRASRRHRPMAALPRGLEELESRLLLSANAGNAQIRISDVTQQEGQIGQTLFVFTVSLSSSSAQGPRPTVNYSTQDGTAKSGTDYAATSGKLTFERGQTSKTITVVVYGDQNPELDEAFYVNLRSPSHATIADGQGVGNIQNDDSQINISGVTLQEGSSGKSQAVATVTLSNPQPVTVTVNYATSDGTATAGSDYDAVSGTLTFAPGETSKTISVPVTGDNVGEDDEYFSINLSNATNAAIVNGTSYVTILDSSPRFYIDSAAVTKGSSGTQPMTFTVYLSSSDGESHTVDFVTLDGTAIAGEDYITNFGTLTFAPGETSKTITIDIIGDTIDWYDQYFFVSLSNASANTFITGSTGVGTIYDVYGDPYTYYDPGWYDPGNYYY